jgi:hypothetical protein
MYYSTVGTPGLGSSNQFETFTEIFMLSVGLKTAMFTIGIMAGNTDFPNYIRKFEMVSKKMFVQVYW